MVKGNCCADLAEFKRRIGIFYHFLSLTISSTKYEPNLSALNAMRGGDRRNDRDLPGQVPDPYDSRDSRGGRGKMGE